MCTASSIQIKVHLEHEEDPGNVEGDEGALHKVEKNKEDKVCQLGKKWGHWKGLRYQGRNTLKHSNNFCDFASNPPTFTLTREVRVITNRVFKWVSRFLLVGRTEKKKLQSARQDEFEMTIDSEYLQADQLIILDLD